MAQLYIATQTFVSNRHGREAWIVPSQIAEAGSWPLDVSPESFVPLTIDYPAPGSRLAAHKPPQQHPQPPVAEEHPPSTAPDAGFVAHAGDKPSDGSAKPPVPDSGFTAHGTADPDAEAKNAEPRVQRQRARQSHDKPARKG